MAPELLEKIRRHCSGPKANHARTGLAHRQRRNISSSNGLTHAPKRCRLLLVTPGTIGRCWFVLPILRWCPGLARMIDRFEVEASQQRLQLCRLKLSQIFVPERTALLGHQIATRGELGQSFPERDEVLQTCRKFFEPRYIVVEVQGACIPSSQSEGGSDTHQLHLRKMMGFAAQPILRTAYYARGSDATI